MIRQDSRYAVDDGERMVGSSMSLRGLSGELRQRWGVPMQEGRGMREGVVRQVDRIVEDQVRQAFEEGYFRGCAAGVEAAATGDWEYFVVPRRCVVCNTADLGEVNLRPRRVQRD